MAKRLYKILIVGIVGFAVQGCISAETTWKRHATTTEQFAIDRATCRSMARKEIDDKYNKPAKHWYAGGVNNVLTYHKLMRKYDARRDTRKIFERCLTNFGYDKINPIVKEQTN